MKFQKSMKKKIGAILLAGVMALAAFPLTTLAAEGNQFLPPDFTKAEMEETIKEYVNYTPVSYTHLGITHSISLTGMFLC